MRGIIWPGGDAIKLDVADGEDELAVYLNHCAASFASARCPWHQTPTVPATFAGESVQHCRTCGDGRYWTLIGEEVTWILDRPGPTVTIGYALNALLGYTVTRPRRLSDGFTQVQG